MSFDSLGLGAELLRAVQNQGYTEPTPIQQRAIPVVLAGRDLLAGAQTGTGKTAGFTLPMLERLSTSQARGRGVRALILTPTRELAAQVGESVANYGAHLSLRSAIIFGGVNINPQIRQLKNGVDILIATPGRLLDHARQGNVDLSKVEILVLDEADRMLDMGFIHDIKRVMALIPPPGERQGLLFSATFPDAIRKLAAGMLVDPATVDVSPRNSTVERIEQRVYPVDKTRKRELLSHLIGTGNWRQVLVFTKTKHGANRLAKQLTSDGLPSAAIHGNRTQAARTRALSEFKSGAVRILVATDIAARGIDIDQLPHVINFDLPFVPEDYVHRIGRTGRAGNEGEAASLVCMDEKRQLQDIERLVGKTIPRTIVEGYEPTNSESTNPKEPARGSRPRPAQRRSSGRGAANAAPGRRRGGGGGQANRGQSRRSGNRG